MIWSVICGVMLVLTVSVMAASSVSGAVTKPAGLPQHRDVLILVGMQYGLPVPDSVVAETLVRLKGKGVSVANTYVEYLDNARHPEPEHEANLTATLRNKLRRTNIGLVVVISQGAMDFLTREGDKFLAPDVPVLTAIVQNTAIPWHGHTRNILTVPDHVDVAGTLRHALTLFPQSRRLVVIAGGSDRSAPYLKATAEAVAQLPSKLDVEYTSDLKYEDMLARVASLPPDTLVLCGTYFSDRTGRAFIPVEVVSEINKRSNAPVFALYDAHVHAGFIGGSVWIPEIIGQRVGDLSYQLLTGELKLNPGVTEAKVEPRPVFDWMQIKRWGGNPEILPSGTVFLNRPQTIWGEYRKEVITAGTAITILAILSAVLVFENQSRRKTERSLSESEERYRVMFEQAADAIVICSMDGRILASNMQACRQYGYTQEEFRKLTIADIDTPEEAEYHMPARLETINRDGLAAFEAMHRNARGELFPVDVTVAKILFAGKPAMISNWRDISERKKSEAEKAKLEAQLHQSHKMESIGQLAGGVAHDFNNILTVIGGYCSLLQMDDSLNAEQKMRMSEIATSVDKATQLTHGLLAFSRKQPLMMKHEELNEIIQHVHKFLIRVIGEDVTLTTASSGAELHVLADRGQIEQVLINLATNARDAMPNGGSFSISTEQVLLDSSFMDSHVYDVPPGNYALLTVTDTGDGISKAHLNHIFEPFFTTKGPDKGTGLGLAIIYGIIKQHNGFINVYSEQGQGTTFRIYLPIQTAKDTSLVKTMNVTQPLGGNEIILVAEDEPAVRMMMSMILKNGGYEVILAEDGDDAVEKFKLHQDRINLILMDVIMPKKNGKEAYEVIKRIRPGIKVLFASGYTADFIESRGISEEALNLINKPVKPSELLQRVRELLDGKG